MKTPVQTACFFLLFFFCFLVCPSSCASEASTDRRAYTRSELDVRLSGSLDGIDVVGILQSRPDTSGDGARAVFRFESPESLCGVVLSLDREGCVNVRYMDIQVPASRASGISDLFMPVIEMGEISSLRKGESGEVYARVLNENCDLEYVFSKDSSIPSLISGKYKGRTLSLRIEPISGQRSEKKQEKSELSY